MVFFSRNIWSNASFILIDIILNINYIINNEYKALTFEESHPFNL